MCRPGTSYVESLLFKFYTRPWMSLARDSRWPPCATRYPAPRSAWPTDAVDRRVASDNLMDPNPNQDCTARLVPSSLQIAITCLYLLPVSSNGEMEEPSLHCCANQVNQVMTAFEQSPTYRYVIRRKLRGWALSMASQWPRLWVMGMCWDDVCLHDILDLAQSFLLSIRVQESNWYIL